MKLVNGLCLKEYNDQNSWRFKNVIQKWLKIYGNWKNIECELNKNI